MKYIIVSAVFLIYLNSCAQYDPSIQEYYDEIFDVSKENYEGKTYLSSSVKILPSEHKLAQMVNNNKIFLEYWLVNYVDLEEYHKLRAIEEEEELKQEFLSFLKKDSLFNPLMMKFSEKATDPAFVADTVSMDKMLNVAVKYFNILGITEEGYYKGKVCAGINGITETLAERKPELEAFCFSAILNNLQGEKFNMYNEFVAAIKELYKQELGVEREAKILRAQGAMFSLMRNNEQLRRILISEYERRRNFLPFVLDYSATKKS